MLTCQTLPRCFALLLITLSGCANWHSSADQQSAGRGLPAPRRDPGGAVLEVAFVSILNKPPSQADPVSKPRQPSGQADPAALADPPSQSPASASDLPDSDPLPGSGKSDESNTAWPDEDSAGAAADPQSSTDPTKSTGPQSSVTPGAVTPSAVAGGREQEDIWHWIDETVVAPEVRHALRRNGLRIGKAQRVGDFTERLARIRRNTDPTANVLEIAEVQSDLSHQARKITCRIGKRYELPVRQPAAGDQAVLVTLGGKTVGQTLSHAQPLFALRATTADVNSIRLSLRPEIQHGAMRQTWVGSDAALRIDNRRDCWSLDELVTEIPLEKGAMLVAGCITPAFGLGQHMFTGTTADGDTDQVLMIIRVAELPELIAP